MFGVNPWKLMTWMGHKRIDETMLYVHFAEAHLRRSRSRSWTCSEPKMTPTRRSSRCSPRVRSSLSVAVNWQ
ncbi:MAG: hypothetical protein E6J91_51250 [Deltaproteobacteria bacterium]|nr:MAG: hypothetical protein E6J91_51250 [Deltaproteobacteria bacterium]